MEIEYSTEVRGRVHAYRFVDWEKKLIVKYFTIEIKRLIKKVKSIENNPKNDE